MPSATASAATAGTSAAAGKKPETSIEVQHGDVPLQLDVGFMTSVDANEIDFGRLTYKTEDERAQPPQGQPQASSSKTVLTESGEAYLVQRARNATQHLLNHIFALPFVRNPDVGPLATLPPITPAYRLSEPREKALPPPGGKPLTKWEKFARAKGIQHSKKDRMVWDDDKKEWVARWGFKGQNKDEENQWIHEVPANAEEGYNPAAAAKKARKERKASNESKRLKNLQRSAAASASASAASRASADANLGGHLIDPKAKRDAERAAKKSQLEGDILRSKRSTASMGRFDRALPNEDKAFKTKGIKRKFDPTERDVSDERDRQLEVLQRMDRHGLKAGKSSARAQGDPSLINERKAVKFASGGRGGVALARDSAKGGGGKTRGKGRR